MAELRMRCVRFYVLEGWRVGHHAVRDWLFEQARAEGIPGGTAFRAAAGFGDHGLHMDHFFELAGGLPEVVEFLADATRAESLIRRVAASGQHLRYVVFEVSGGVTGV